MLQKTIKKPISFAGVGLHTGCHVKARIVPAGKDTGISFVRKDLPGTPPIQALAKNVVSTAHATTLGADGATVSTVEHIMAAFYGLGVDNAVVELYGPEVPVLDGSAARFIEMIDEAGLRSFKKKKKFIVIKKPIKISDGDKMIHLLPSDDMEFSVDYSIDFSHPFLGAQSFYSLFSRDVFTKEVARARTFGFLRDVEAMRASGLAKGGSLSNAVVIGDDEIINKDGLRYPDEFVRHKVLDVMGDISLAGAPIIGHLKAHRAGHGLNYLLVEKLLKNPGKWELCEMPVKEELDDVVPAYAPNLLTA